MQVSKLVPEVYYKESRDFSYVGRLFEIIFNYMKTNADSMVGDIKTENINPNMLDLLVNTLGFESKHDYVVKDLINIASVFSDLIKHKGTRYAIEKAVRTLMNSQNIDSTLEIDFGVKNEDDNLLVIYVPKTLKDIVLLEDLFDYILPAGWLYKFILVESESKPIRNKINVSNKEFKTYKLNNPTNYSQVIGNIGINNLKNIENINQIPVNTIYSGVVTPKFNANDEGE